jgi:replicative DNA helicase
MKTLETIFSENINLNACSPVWEFPKDSIRTGFVAYDEGTRGLLPGEVHVVSGRPGMGKTSFALGIALSVVKNQERPVYYFTGHRSQAEIAMRLISLGTRIPHERLMMNDLASGETQQCSEYMEAAKNLPLYIGRPTCMKLELIEELILRSRRGPGLIIIDKFHCLSSDNGSALVGEMKVKEYFHMAEKLKVLAKGLDCAVIVLADASSGCEAWEDKRPALTDLKEGSEGLLEYADSVCSLFRGEFYDVQYPEQGIGELIFTKNRKSRLTRSKLAWLGHCMMWANLAKAPDNVTPLK